MSAQTISQKITASYPNAPSLGTFALDDPTLEGVLNEPHSPSDPTAPPETTEPTSDETSIVLKRRQTQVLVALGSGKTVKQIGYELGLSQRTVYLYIYELRQCFGGLSREQMLLRAQSKGYIKCATE